MMDTLVMDKQARHTHECRDCGGSISCYGDGERCWAGGNDGCVRCNHTESTPSKSEWDEIERRERTARECGFR